MRLLIIAAVLAVASAASIKHEFLSFQKKFGKVYSSEEEHNKRFQVFSDNLRKINAHNAEKHSYTKGVNQFSDLTEEEFVAQYMGGYKRTPSTAGGRSYPARQAVNLPDSVDWRNVSTAVKNQGQCGSCWAFATTELVESYHAIATGNLVELSSQQVTSCTPNPLSCGGIGGCMGSIPQLGYSYLQLFGHIADADYPYTSGSTTNTGSCDYDVNSMPPAVGITGYDTLEPNSQEALMNHVATVGPVAVAVYASLWGSYGGGVFDGCSYNSNIALNHAVMLVGYGTDPNEGDYWLVRNSWGTSWGESGYIKLKRDATAQCGVDSSPMDGTACVNGPGNDEQKVCGQCGVLFDLSYPLGAHSK